MANERIARAILELRTDDAQFNKGLEAAVAKLGGVESKVQSLASGLKGFGDKAAALGKSLTVGLTLPIVGAGAAAVTAALQIDDALDTIRLGTGATGDDLSALEASFRTVFKQVPDDAKTVATALADISTRTGLVGPPLEALTAQLLTLARVTGSEIGPTVAASTRLFGDWSVATDQQSGTLDKMLRASQASGIGIGTLMEKLVQFGAPLRQMGFDLDQSAAMLGKWEKEGVNTELVLGSLRIAAANFTREGVPLREGLEQTIQKIQALGPGTDAIGLALKTFGAKAGPDMAAAILEGRFAIDEYVKAIRDGSDTIATAAADTDGFQEQLAKLKNQATLVLEPLGVRLLSALQDLMPAITSVLGFVAGLVEGFSKLSPAAQTVILGIGGVAAAVGPLLAFIGTLASGIGTVVGWFAAGSSAAGVLGTALSVLTGPIGLVIGAVTGLTIAWMKWGDDVTGFVTKTFGAIKSYLWDKLEPVLKPLIGLMQSIGAAFEAFAALVGAVFVRIVKIHVDAIGTVVSWLVDKLQPVFRPLGAAISAIADIFSRTYTAVAGLVERLYGAVKTWLLDRFTAIVEGIRQKIDAVTGFFRDMYTAVVGQSYVPDMIDGIASEFARLEGVMVAPVDAATSNVTERFEGMLDRVTGSIRDFGDSIGGRIESWIGGPVGTALGGIASGIVGSLSSIITGGVDQLIALAVDLAMKGLEWLGKKVWSGLKKIGGWFKGLFGGGGSSGVDFSDPADWDRPPDPGLGPYGGDQPEGFAWGTPGLDFAAFRRSGQAIIAHGDEAIIPRGSGHELAGEIAAALRRLLPTTNGGETVLMIDKEVLGRVVAGTRSHHEELARQIQRNTFELATAIRGAAR